MGGLFFGDRGTVFSDRVNKVMKKKLIFLSFILHTINLSGPIHDFLYRIKSYIRRSIYLDQIHDSHSHSHSHSHSSFPFLLYFFQLNAYGRILIHIYVHPFIP